MSVRDKQMPWEPSLLVLTMEQGKPDPMRYDSVWRAHVVDMWRQIAGIPSVFEKDR